MQIKRTFYIFIEGQYNLSINNINIKHSKSIKFLGLEVDENLSWTQMCDNIVSILNKKCYLIRCLRDSLDFTTIRSIYFSEVESRLRYGILFWGTSTSVERVLLAQKRIVRSMAFASYREHCKPLFKQFRILTVVNLYILEVAAYIHSIKDAIPINPHEYNTRNNIICTPKHRLHLSSLGPKIMGLKIYNHLPDRFKSLTFNVFKRTLKCNLLDCPLYKIDDFFNFNM